MEQSQRVFNVQMEEEVYIIQESLINIQINSQQVYWNKINELDEVIS